MIANWIVYYLVLTLLLGGAALVVEPVLLRWRLATRWVWAAAMAGTVAIPALLLVGRQPLEAETADAVADAAVGEFAVGFVATMAPFGAPMLDVSSASLAGWHELLGWLWAAGSATLLLYLIGSGIQGRASPERLAEVHLGR